MSNIVDFPPNRREYFKSAIESRAAQAERASVLRAALDENRPMRPTDQIQVAEGIWRLLDRLDAQGITKVQVLLEAGLVHHKTDSTKHLGQYAINPDRLAGSSNTARLNKKPEKYRKIIDAVAKKANLDADDILLEVFGDTSLAEPGLTQDASPEFEELARRLCDIAGAIAIKHDLQTYFREFLRSGVSLQVFNDDEETEQRRLMPEDIELFIRNGVYSLDWPINFRSFNNDFHNHDCETNVPTYPSMTLGTFDVGEPCRFYFDQKEDMDEEKAVSSNASAIEGQYNVELRLCIVPVGPDLRPESALRVRVGLSCLSPLSESHLYERTGPAFEIRGAIPTLMPHSVEAETFSDEPAISYRLWTDGSLLPKPLEKYFPQQNRNWRGNCVFLPMTGIIAQDWFNLMLLSGPQLHAMDRPLHIRVLGRDLASHTWGDYFSPFKSGTVAAGVDHCLSGHSGINPLDLLDTRAKQFVELFRDASASARTRRDVAMHRLEVRLRKMRDEKPPPR